MKKLITLTILGLMLLGASTFAQDDTTRDPARDFRIPRFLYSNEEIKPKLEGYREASGTFRTALTELRQKLAAAAEAEKAGIREELKALLKSHREAQANFRKEVRRIIRDLRASRTSDSEG